MSRRLPGRLGRAARFAALLFPALGVFACGPSRKNSAAIAEMHEVTREVGVREEELQAVPFTEASDFSSPVWLTRADPLTGVSFRHHPIWIPHANPPQAACEFWLVDARRETGTESDIFGPSISVAWGWTRARNRLEFVEELLGDREPAAPREWVTLGGRDFVRLEFRFTVPAETQLVYSTFENGRYCSFSARPWNPADSSHANFRAMFEAMAGSLVITPGV